MKPVLFCYFWIISNRVIHFNLNYNFKMIPIVTRWFVCSFVLSFLSCCSLIGRGREAYLTLNRCWSCCTSVPRWCSLPFYLHNRDPTLLIDNWSIHSVCDSILLKKVGSARLRESGIHPISLKTPAPQYQPIDRKKRKGKRVEEYSRERAA